ncbi:MAG TPA: tetratricopeptide repeat protein [Pyrinomonadaceae bacterium]|nr:tetratricopeptide repeat protein [Pyrinomonadaceae bacterium]
MIKRNKFSAVALATALLLAPFTPALTVNANARNFIQQDSDIPSDAEQAMFTKGQNLYNQGRYDQSVTVLQDFLKTYPRSIITDLTLLWLGRSYMQLGKLKEAEQIGQRLHTIKDTPFADIYDGELETARAEAGTRPVTPASNTVASKTPETKPPASKPVARKIPNATPTPTPRLVRDNTGVKPPQTKQTPQLVADSKTPTRQGTEGGRPVKQPAINPASTPTTTQLSPSEVVSPTRRGIRPGRRVLNKPPVIQPDAIAGQSIASPTTSKKPAIANNSPRPTQQQRTSVAANNPPRPTPTPITPIIRPTPTYTAPPITTPVRTPETAMNTSPGISTPTNESPSLQSSGGLSLTVKQVPNLVLALRSNAEFAQPGQSVQLPLTVTNTGNKEDQFRLETDLPAEYQPSFSLAQSGSGTELPIFVTPQLTRGSSIEVMLNLRVPETASDGQQLKFFVRAASQADYQVLKVADGSINVVAASLSAATNVSDSSVMPGETFTQTITVKNAGSSPAKQTRADFVFNPNFELVSANPSPINYDKPSRTAVWSLGDLSSRGSRDISVTLRAVPDALASTNPLGRGAVRTQSLSLGSNFDSPSVTVGKVPKARIDAVSVGLTTTPGDTLYIPFIVRNPGNAADTYELRVTAPGAPSSTIYADTNGDGQHQESEPTIAQTSQIDPKGGQFPLLLGVQIPASTPDRQQFSYNVVARSLLSSREASEANTVLTVATPRVRVRTEEAVDTVAAGDTIFYRLVLVNEGSGLAKNLVVNEMLPDALQFVNSDPALSAQDAPGTGQRFTWRVAELAPGDTAVLRVAVRLRPNLPAEQTLNTRHTLGYQDTNGNGYSGQ